MGGIEYKINANQHSIQYAQSKRIFGIFLFILMQNIKRNMTVTDSPGDNNSKPMIRIANRFLLSSGFLVGNKIEVKYRNGRIIINRLPFQKA
jgi:hypothetical protein